MTKKKICKVPPLFPKRHQLLSDSGAWEVDEFSREIFPELEPKKAVYAPRLAVFEAYEFARGRAIDAANLTKICRELSSGLSALLEVWRRVSRSLTRAAKDLEQFPVTAVWWDFGLWESQQPKKLSPAIMAGQSASRIGTLAPLMEELDLLCNELPKIGRGRELHEILRLAFSPSKSSIYFLQQPLTFDGDQGRVFGLA